MDNEFDFYYKYFNSNKQLADNLIDLKLFDQIRKAYETIIDSLRGGHKLLIFGNGGSAAQATHFAAELVCKFEKNRHAIPAIALTTDTSVITAQSNDLSFDSVFARQIEALGQWGDVAIGLTTSDAEFSAPDVNFHSLNMLQGFSTARAQKMHTVGLVSKKTKRLLILIDHPIIVPEENTALIQNAHLAILHFLCKAIEENL
ncbi:MAG: SIS domain-containing protein [Patescibacteria group bacterium]